MNFRIILLLFFQTFSWNLFSQISFSINFQHPHCNNANDGAIVINVTSNYPPYQYSWSTSATTAQINNLSPATYSVLITDGIGNDTLISIPLLELPCPVVPELVFTPNNDGINDTWTITNLEFYPNFKLVVYNRWGQQVFKISDKYEPWDGKQLGENLPSATYYYVLELDRQLKSEEYILKGAINIVR